MIAAVRKLVTAASRGPRTRVVFQAIVSLVLIVLVVRTAPHENLVAAWHAVGLGTLLLACGWFALAALTNVRRWQILLRSQNIEEGAVRLTEVFFIGLFCSLFLPTAAGGDAFRVYEVARRGRSTVRVLLATLQDRLLSLGITTAFGFAGACYYFDLLPHDLAVPVLVLCGFGIVVAVALFYLGHFLQLATRLLAGFQVPPLVARWLEGKAAVRLVTFLGPLREAPPLNPWRTLRVAGLALATFLSAVAMYAVVCDALDVHCGLLAMCMIVSLVGVVRMLPISLGGIGVSEGAFVYLTGLFGIANGKAVPVALVILGVGTFMSLLGGLLLLRRTVLGMRTSTTSETASPAIFPLPVFDADQGGTCRHAA